MQYAPISSLTSWLIFLQKLKGKYLANTPINLFVIQPFPFEPQNTSLSPPPSARPPPPIITKSSDFSVRDILAPSNSVSSVYCFNFRLEFEFLVTDDFYQNLEPFVNSKIDIEPEWPSSKEFIYSIMDSESHFMPILRCMNSRISCVEMPPWSHPLETCLCLCKLPNSIITRKWDFVIRVDPYKLLSAQLIWNRQRWVFISVSMWFCFLASFSLECISCNIDSLLCCSWLASWR